MEAVAKIEMLKGLVLEIRGIQEDKKVLSGDKKLKQDTISTIILNEDIRSYEKMDDCKKLALSVMDLEVRIKELNESLKKRNIAMNTMTVR